MTSTQSQVPAKSSPKNDIKALLQSERVRNEIADVAPKYMDPERMLKVALATVMRDHKLLQCTQTSLLLALMRCSEAGLEPDGYHAYLIPYGDVAQAIFGYQGLIYIAAQHGVTSVDAESVCEKDVFKWTRPKGLIEIYHEIDWKEPRGKEKSYYAVSELDGRMQYAVMTIDEIEAIRKPIKGAFSESSPWVKNYGEMCKKTVLRRLAKRWPRKGRLHLALMNDDDTPIVDKFAPKAPVFNQPMRSPTMDFLETPAGVLTGAPMGEDNEKELGELGLAPQKIGSPEHEAFEQWMFSKGILYSQLAEIEDLGIDQYPTLRDIPIARIKTLELAKDQILVAAKGVRS